MFEQFEFLEHEAHARDAVIAQPAIVEAREVGLVDEDSPAGRAEDAGDQLELATLKSMV